jgi:Flp pilus assembly protein TadB
MKIYLFVSCVFAVVAALLAIFGFQAFIAIPCIAISMASLFAYKTESGIAKEEKEFTKWKP